MALVSTSFLERISLAPAPLALDLKLVNLVPSFMSLALFELLPLHWSLEGVSFEQVSLCVCAVLLRAAEVDLPQPFVFLGYNSC